MNSAMIATEPLGAQIWDAIGWDNRETLGDTAHGFFYAQRTVDSAQTRYFIAHLHRLYDEKLAESPTGELRA